jgi:pimeloyl-ACP methyl ester carboxylesterase
MLMLHGWPSTSLEWEKVIPDLVDPEDDKKPAFHIIAPDLPGFGFSPAPKATGLGPAGHSAVFASLMKQLGYERYVLYSTDLGTVVAMSMIVEYAAEIINHVTDFYMAFPNDSDTARLAANQTTAEENAYIASMSAFLGSHSAYSSLHSTYPLSIAYALNDSPVGFLAWVYHIAFTVNGEAYAPSDIITQAFLLYLPGVYGNIRSYKELFGTANFAPKKNFTVPTSVLQFGYAQAGDDYPYPEIKSFEFVVSFVCSLFFFVSSLLTCVVSLANGLSAPQT